MAPARGGADVRVRKGGRGLVPPVRMAARQRMPVAVRI
jgi:hypothetical protein